MTSAPRRPNLLIVLALIASSLLLGTTAQASERMQVSCVEACLADCHTDDGGEPSRNYDQVGSCLFGGCHAAATFLPVDHFMMAGVAASPVCRTKLKYPPLASRATDPGLRPPTI